MISRESAGDGPARPDPAAGAQPAVWDEVKRLSGSTRRLKAIIDDMQLLSLAEATAVVKSGTLSALARSARREIEDVFLKATGRKITLSFEGGEVPRTPQQTDEPEARAPGAAPATPTPGPDARQHPLVKQAEELLGARVVRIEARGRGT